MSQRVYLPTTLTELAQHVAAESFPVPVDPITAPDDSEEAEYAALMSAADASAELLAGPGRRVVVVAELAELAGGAVQAGQVELRQVVAVHADTHDRPVDADPDEDLAWFATQEIPDLL